MFTETLPSTALRLSIRRANGLAALPDLLVHKALQGRRDRQDRQGQQDQQARKDLRGQPARQ